VRNLKATYQSPFSGIERPDVNGIPVIIDGRENDLAVLDFDRQAKRGPLNLIVEQSAWSAIGLSLKIGSAVAVRIQRFQVDENVRPLVGFLVPFGV